MVENKVNWNTVLVVLVIGVVGILLLNNLGVLTGNVAVKATTGTLDKNDKTAILNMLNSCQRVKQPADSYGTCSKVCYYSTPSKTCVIGQEVVGTTDNNKLIDCNEDYTGYGATLNCICCSS